MLQSKQLPLEVKIRFHENNKIENIPKTAHIMSNWKSLFCSISECLYQSFLDDILNNKSSNIVKLSIKA